ncbi:MAG: T9SS type A sorting domain-containing protein [Candidatus Kapabacteria bacterium]|nr:T9SS type A sorting domain-containing protein [Candidatus Kapabacteria bacterium]
MRFVKLLISLLLIALISDFAYSAPPTVQATNITFSSITTSSMRINVTRGNGARRIFVVSQHSTSTPVTIANPVDFSAGYQASSDWNYGSPSGTDINSGAQNDYIVYDGTGRYVTLTNLVAGAYYTVKVFEYNGTGFSTAEYLTSNGSSGNPRTTNITPEAPTNLSVSNVTNIQFQAGWTEPTGVFDGYDFMLDGTNNSTWSNLIEGYDPADLGDDANPLIIEDLDNDEDYYWQIRAKSGYRYSTWATYSQAVTTLPNPPTISNPPAPICYNTTAIIDPDDVNNYEFRFYDAASGGNRLDNGGANNGVNTWETPQLTQNTSYWVSSFNTVTQLESNTRTQVTITVIQLPNFTGNHPVDAIVCNGTSYQFTSNPSNANEYKWQRNDGNGYVDIDGTTDGGVYSNYTTTALQISDVTGLDGYAFKLLARNQGCPTNWVESDEAFLTVPLEPDFTGNQPSDATICKGSNHTFTSNPLNADTYKWQRNDGNGFVDINGTLDGGVYSGFNTISLNISNVTGLNGYTYRLLAKNQGCPANWNSSNIVTLTVPNEPDFTGNHPANATVCQGANHTFSSTPTNADTYKWQRNDGSGFIDVNGTLDGGVYSGFTTTSLNISDVTGLNGYQYRLLAKNNGCPTAWVTSNSATLTVPTEPNFTGNHPVNATVCQGGSHIFTSTPANANQYKWQRNDGNGFADIDGTTDGGIYSGFNTTSLTISDVTGLDGYEYRLLARNSGCPTSWTNSNSAELTVTPIPVFTTQPQSIEVCNYGSGQFTAVVTPQTEVKWQYSLNQNNWNDVPDNDVFDGVNTTTLDILDVSGLSDYYFRLIARNNNCPTNWIASNIVGISYLPNPEFTSQPQSHSVCDGSSTQFSVTTNNATNYIWQIFNVGWNNLSDGGVYSGTQTSTLVISDVTGLNNNRYRVRALNSACPLTIITSNEATLTVVSQPTLVSSPENAGVCENSQHNFTAQFNNASSYQWQFREDAQAEWSSVPDNDDFDNVTTNTLHIANVNNYNGYQFRVLAFNTGNCPTNGIPSDFATLTVSLYPDFTGNHPSDATICQGSEHTFTSTPANANQYKWQRDDGNGFVDINGTLDGGVYSGFTTTSLNITNVNGLNGYKYKLLARNNGCPSEWSSSNVATLTVPTEPNFTNGQPEDAVVCSGSSYSFVTNPTNANEFRWQRNDGNDFEDIDEFTDGGIYSGYNTPTLEISDVTGLDGFSFRLYARNSGCPLNWVSSDVVTITVPLEPDFEGNQPENATVCSGNNHSFVSAPINADEYKWQRNNGQGFVDINANTDNGVYSGYNTTSLNISNVSGLDGYTYRLLARNMGCPENWAASESALLTVPTEPDFTGNHPQDVLLCAGSEHTFVSTPTNADVVKWQRYDGINYQDINSNTDGGVYSGFNTTSLHISDVTGLDGYEYRLLAKNNGCPENWAASNPAVLLVPAEPDFTDANPESAEVCNGTSHIFYSDPFFADEYKWQRDAGNGFEDIDENTDGEIYSGFNTIELTISDVSGLDGYQFRLLAKNSGCPQNWVASDVAELTILYPPTFVSHPADLEVCENSGEHSFTTTVNGTDDPMTYQWQRSTDGQNFVDIEEDMDGITYSGYNTTTLTLSDVTVGMNGYQFRLLASNSCQESVASNVATLSVKTAPVIASHPENYDGCVNGTAIFTVQVTGSTPIDYQWMISTDQGNNWSELEDNNIYNGTTTSTLQVSNLTIDMDGNLFKVVVSNNCEANIESNTALLNLLSAPSVVLDPIDEILCEGQAAEFTAEFSGDNLTYRWTLSTDGENWSVVPDNEIYDGVNTNTLTINEGFIDGTMDGYYYRLEAQNNCNNPEWLATEAAQLIVNDKPSATLTGNGPLCEGEDAIFTFTLTGTAPFNIVYFDGQENQEINNINDYEYQVVIENADQTLTYKVISVSDALCVNNDEGDNVTINVSAYPTAFNLIGDETYCAGADDASLELSSSEIGVSYQLFKNGVEDGQPLAGTGNSIVWTNKTSGTYVVVAYNDLTGCSNTMNGEVVINELPLPTVYELSGNTEYCEGDNGVTLTLDNSDIGFTYQLMKNGNPEGDALAGTGDALVWDNVLAGIYTVVSTNDNTGCSIAMNGEITVIEKELPNAQILGAPIRNVCNGSDVTLNAVEVEGATYQWLFNSLEILGATESSYTIENIQVFDEGDYSVVVTKDGCVNTSDIVEIDVEETPSQLGQFTAGEDEVCQGTQNVEYIVPPVDGIDYNWNFTGEGVEILENGNSVILNFGENATSGDLEVVAVNSCGASLPRIKSVVVNPLPNASIGSNSPVCEGTSIELTAQGGVAYQWTGPNGFESDEQNPIIENAELINSGEYFVNIITANGCIKTLSVEVDVLDAPEMPGEFTQYTTTVARPQNGVVFTVPEIEGMTYNWSYSGSDVTINGSGNSVTLNFGGDATSGILSVTTSNDCGESEARTLEITVTGPYLVISEIGTQNSGEAFDITVTAMDNDEEYFVNEDTPINITVNTGSGTVSGSGTILEGNSSVVISVTYTNNNGEVGVKIKADNNGGEAFEAGVSNEFKVIASQPTTQAFNITFYDVRSDRFTINWNRGSGSGSFVVARVASAVNVTPETGVEYDAADNNYSSAPSIGTPSDNNKIVYWGTSNSFTMTGLTALTRYHIRIWGYNGNPGLGTENFCFGSGVGNPTNQRTARFRDAIEGDNLSQNSLFEVGDIVPNPAKDKISFNIQVFESIAFSIEVYNMAGEKVTVAMNNNELPIGTKVVEIPFSNVAAGQYIVKVTAGNEMVIIPFILMP